MLETVVECLVKRKLTNKAIFQRSLMVVIDIIVLIISFITLVIILPIIGVILIVFAGIFTYLVFRNTNIEYEYAFFDGEMTVDKIMNKKIRKRLHTFSFSKMEVMAPEGSPRIRSGNNQHKIFDFSSGEKNATVFVAVLYDEKNRLGELKFEPNEELLTRLQRSYPRKIYLD